VAGGAKLAPDRLDERIYKMSCKLYAGLPTLIQAQANAVYTAWIAFAFADLNEAIEAAWKLDHAVPKGNVRNRNYFYVTHGFCTSMVNGNGYFTDGFLRFCEIILCQLPISEFEPAVGISGVCDMIAREVADVLAGIELFQQCLLVWDILRLHEQTAKRNPISPIITESTDSDELEGDVSVHDKIGDRINVFLANLERVPDQFKIGIVEH
jgi:hypothetical protein